MHGSPYPSVQKASALTSRCAMHCPGGQTSRIQHEPIRKRCFLRAVSVASDIQKGCKSNQNVQNIVGCLSHFTKISCKNKNIPALYTLVAHFVKDKEKTY